jgi:hypothetical protein
MNRWLRDPDVHAMVDGVPVEAIPHVPAGQPRHLAAAKVLSSERDA